MVSAASSASAATGHKRIPSTNAGNPKDARMRVRRELNDIPYPGALTGRLERYAAEPAPDTANLTAISERSANGAEKPATARLIPKRIGQLPANLGRNQLVVDAIMIGQLIFRHPVGPEQNIPERKRSGEVGIAALRERCVLPAVEHRRCKHVFKRTQRPAQIGVNERRMKHVERRDPEHDVRRNT